MTGTGARGAGPAERAHHAGGDGSAPAGSDPRGRQRMSAKREQNAVLRLLRGEDLELVSRELRVPAAELSAWRDAFLAAGEASLKTRPADGRDVEITRLKAKVGDLVLGLRPEDGQRAAGRQDRADGDGPPFGPPEVEMMSRARSPSANRAYGILRVTRVWGMARATLYRHRLGDPSGPRRRPGPLGPLPDEALVEAIRELLAASPFHGEGYRKRDRDPHPIAGPGSGSPASAPPNAASCG